MSTIDELRMKAESDGGSRGYYLNPNEEMLDILFSGMQENERRFGYTSCPCRLATGNFDLDKDIVCPCDYRDADVDEFGYCYCALYVRRDVIDGQNPPRPIPERRHLRKLKAAMSGTTSKPEAPEAKPARPAFAREATAGERLWYCKQCGYVAFREEPPHLCPICKAKREVFAEIAIGVTFSAR